MNGGFTVVERYKLEEIALIVASLTTPNISNFSEIGQPLITAENLKWLAFDGDIRLLPKLHVAVNGYIKCAKVPAKTIILTKNSTESVNTYIFQCEQDVYIANDVVAIIPNESIVLSDYLHLFLKWLQPKDDWRQWHHILLDIPPIEMQTNIVKLLKTSQLLLKNKTSLLAVVEELPQHFRHISKQTERHTRQLNHGFDQLQTFYNYTLHKIFTGELFHVYNKFFERNP